MPSQTQPLPLSIESRDINFLVPLLRERVEQLTERCKSRGIVLGIGTTIRGPDIQARLWCRSRTPEDVKRRRDFISKSAPRIAALLKPEYAGLGPQMTSHPPMSSWHQVGEAVDVYVNVGGKAIWDGSTALAIAGLCKEIGLPHSYNEKTWEVKSRHWHVQLRRAETPFMVRGLFDSWADAERAMLEKFDLTSAGAAPAP